MEPEARAEGAMVNWAEIILIVAIGIGFTLFALFIVLRDDL